MSKPNWYHSPTSVFGFMFVALSLGIEIGYAVRDAGMSGTTFALIALGSLLLGGILLMVGK